MKIPVTSQFLLLSINKGINPDSFYNQDMIVSLITLGIYELKKENIIKLNYCKSKDINNSMKDRFSQDIDISIVNTLLPKLQHLKVLYEIINKSTKKTITDILSIFFIDFSENYFEKYSNDIKNVLTSNSYMMEQKKRGLFGIEKSSFKINDSMFDKLKHDLDNIIYSISVDNYHDLDTDYENSILLILLVRTDLYYYYYSNKECKIIKEKVDKIITSNDLYKDKYIIKLLQTIDGIYSFALAAVVTLLM